MQPVSLFQAILQAFQHPRHDPPKNAKLVDLKTLIARYPHQAIVVYPECTTTNGRGILPFSPSLLTAPSTAKIFPISLRYTPADITTPLPGTYISFLWNLLSKPTHCIRVRIAESVRNTSEAPTTRSASGSGELVDRASSSDTLLGSEDTDITTSAQKKVLDKVGEALARLGRVKRVGLDLKDKQAFVTAYSKAKGR